MRKKEVENKLIFEEYDPETLETLAETDELDESVLVSNKAAEIIKTSYKNLKSCRVVIGEKTVVIVLAGISFMIIGCLFLIFWSAFRYGEFEVSGFVVGLVFMMMPIGVLIFLLKRYTKLYEIYFFKIQGKNIVFYINKKYTIYYQNRTELVCIRNKTKSEEAYSYDDFMNAKLGYNRLVGNLTVRETKNGYKISARQLKRGTSKFSGVSEALLDKNLNPVKMLVGSQYIYRFKEVNSPATIVTLPKEIKDVCARRDLPPPDDERICYG